MPTYREIGKTLIAAAPAIAPSMAAGALRKLMDIAIDGYSKVPGAKAHAAIQLEKQGDVEKAIDALISQHVAMAGAQGFVTNLGGVATMAVSLPANVAGLAVVQSRMVAAIAHLRGYDVADPRVRSAIAMCLLGESNANDLVAHGHLPSTPLAVATAPVPDPHLDQTVAEKVMSQLMGAIGGKRLAVLAVKRVPLVGGGVGAVADGWSSFEIARFARKTFVSRRPGS